MKKTEKIQLLNANADARELYYINEEMTRVKFLLRSLSARKGIQIDEVEKIISAFRKVRIGSVVNTFIKLQQMSAEAEIPDSHTNNINGLWRRAGRYITEVVALADRLLSACLAIINTLSSDRVGDKKREDNIERALNALESIINKTSRDSVNSTFMSFKNQLNEFRREQTEEAPEMTSDEVSEVSERNPQLSDENSPEVKSESNGVASEDVPEHVDILAGIVTMSGKDIELKQVV